MKITYIAGAVIPSKTANSIQVMKMCQAFKRLGHNVLLIVSNKKAQEDSDQGIDLYNYYGIKEAFEVIKVFWPKSSLGSYIFGFLAAIKAKREGCDIIYSRHLAGAFFATYLKIPTYYEAHKPIASALGEFFFKVMIKKNSFKRLILISYSLKNNFLHQYCINPRKTIVSPDAAEPYESIPDLIEILNNGRLQAGYIGHLYPGKGMEIIKEIAPRCPSVDFNIIGGLEEDISKWKRDTEGINNIIFYGYIPHGAIEQYIGQFHILLAPYLEKVGVFAGGKTDVARWMSPLKIFEYMSAGRPILCSDLPVLREILTNGETAIMLPPGDPDAWVKTVEELKNNPQKMIKIGCNAKKIFNEKYSWQARAQKLEDVIMFDLKKV